MLQGEAGNDRPLIPPWPPTLSRSCTEFGEDGIPGRDRNRIHAPHTGSAPSRSHGDPAIGLYEDRRSQRRRLSASWVEEGSAHLVLARFIAVVHRVDGYRQLLPA